MFLELDKSCCSGLLFDPVVIVCSVSFWFHSTRRKCQIPWFFEIFWGCPSRAGSRSKTSEIPIILSVSGGNPEIAARHSSVASDVLRVDWQRGTLQSCPQFQDNEILSHQTRNLLYPVTLSSEPRVDSLFEDPSVASWTIHPILLVELGHSLHSNAFAILQLDFLGNLLCDFLGRACSSFPILHTN